MPRPRTWPPCSATRLRPAEDKPGTAHLLPFFTLRQSAVHVLEDLLDQRLHLVRNPVQPLKIRLAHLFNNLPRFHPPVCKFADSSPGSRFAEDSSLSCPCPPASASRQGV